MQDVVDVLCALPLELETSTSVDAGADLTVEMSDGRRLSVEVRALRSPSPADVDRLLRSPDRPGRVRLLVGDRLVPRVRDQLRDGGWSWLDRRGHLYLMAPGVLVDTDVAPLSDVSRRARPVLETDVGLDVATALLTEPNRKLSIRALVAFTGRSLGAVHQSVRGLTDDGLVGPGGLPLLPELFWEVTARWRPRRTALTVAPDPTDERLAGQLGLLAPAGGWVLCDTLAANAYGAAAVVRGDHPPDFYVPDERAIRVARQVLGDASSLERRRATVALAPATWTCLRPVELPGPRTTWPAAHPVVVALDLSVDAGRGREVLDGWTPPEPFARVW